MRALPLTVNGMKQACHMQDEATGKIFWVSPTARHNPSTGTAAFSPLGYVKVKESGEFRRVYPEKEGMPNAMTSCLMHVKMGE